MRLAALLAVTVGLVAAVAPGCARRPSATATRAPAPAAPETTSDRGDRFVFLTPIGQMAPEEAPRVPAASSVPAPPPPARVPASTPPPGSPPTRR